MNILFSAYLTHLKLVNKQTKLINENNTTYPKLNVVPRKGSEFQHSLMAKDKLMKLKYTEMLFHLVFQ